MKRRLLIILAVLSLAPTLAAAWLLMTESGLNASLNVARPWIPGELNISELHGSLAGTITVRQADWQYRGYRIGIQDAEVDWGLTALFAARLHFQRLHASGIDITIPEKEDEDGAEPAARIMPLGVAVADMQIRDITLHYKDTDVVFDEVRLEAHSLLQRLTVDRLVIRAEQYGADLKAKLRFVGRHGGNRIEMQGGGSGFYGPLGELKASFNLALLQDNSFEIAKLSVLSPASGSDFDVYGSWKPGAKGGAIDAALNWRRLRWPAGETPWFDSAGGSAWVRGYVEDYEFGLSTESPWPQVPASQWLASARGDLAGMRFHSLRIEALRGELLTQGRIAWTKGFSWQARGRINNIDPGVLQPAWSGRLSAEVISDGRIGDRGVEGNMEIAQLHGKLRDHPLEGEAKARLAGGSVRISELKLASGSATATASGELGDDLNLRWRVSLDNLAELDGRVHGSLKAEGSLNGTREAAQLNLKATGSKIGSSGYQAKDLAVQVRVDLPRVKTLNLKATAKDLDLQGTSMQELSLNADGDANRYGLRLRSVMTGADALLTLDLQRDRDNWQGLITAVDLNLKQDSWHLQEAAGLEWRDHEGQIDPVCLGNGTGRLCLHASHRQQQSRFSASLQELSLAMLTPWLPRDMSIAGVANGDANLRYTAEGVLLGRATLNLPAGTLQYPPLQSQNEPWNYEQISADLKLDERGARLEATARVDNVDQFRLEAALPGARLPALQRETQAVQGSLVLQVSSLQQLEGLFPDLQAIHGEAEARLSVGGTLAAPTLAFTGRAGNGGFHIPRLGVTVSDLQLQADSTDDNRLKYRLDARSGKGKLMITGNTLLDRKQGWLTLVQIKGEEFEVARIPEARVLATPDLNIRLKDHDIHVDGDIYIPWARLRPKDVTTSIGSSDDVVIVGADEEQEQRWTITSAVRLGFGEQVLFDGFGFEGRFHGAVLITEEPGQTTRATGQMNIPEGRYQAYGQRLQIEQGRILYAGGPLDNPGLDIRAIRKVQEVTAGLKVRGTLHQPRVELYSIPAMSQIDSLSYLLLGRKLEGATEDEGAMMARAALALGLKGGDLLARDIGERFGLDEMRIESSAEGDQASLVMGRYLSPRLYVGYGVGLIENVNVFTIRYRISDKWQLKAESGATQGADLLYTIER